MTIEEAKERIQSLYNDWLPVEYDFEVFDTEENKLDREAFALAIEALKAKSEIENSKSEIKNAKTEISMSKSKMTNEEALGQMKQWRLMMSAGDDSDELLRYYIEVMDYAIQALESQRWIPVSEGHPKKGQWCLVTTKWGDTRPWLYYVQTDVWDEYVIAWMPLPEPYKAERSDEE